MLFTLFLFNNWYCPLFPTLEKCQLGGHRPSNWHLWQSARLKGHAPIGMGSPGCSVSSYSLLSSPLRVIVVGKAFLIIVSLSLSNYNHFKLFLREKKSQTCNQYAEEIHGKFFYWSDNTSNCSFCFSFSQFSLMGMKRDHRLFIVGGGRSQSISYLLFFPSFQWLILITHKQLNTAKSLCHFECRLGQLAFFRIKSF